MRVCVRVDARTSRLRARAGTRVRVRVHTILHAHTHFARPYERACVAKVAIFISILVTVRDTRADRDSANAGSRLTPG